MLLQSFKIDRLYGTFDYYLDFTKSKILVLTGLNGYGKTTILRIIASLSSKEDIYYLYEVPFAKIEIRFDGGTKLIISKISTKIPLDGDLNTDELKTTHFSYYRGNKLISKMSIDRDDYLASDFYQNSHHVDDESDEDNYRSLKWLRYRLPDSRDDELDKFIMNLSVFNSTLIHSQRLFNEDRNGDSHEAIYDVKDNLSQILSDAYYSYLDYSQKLDGHQIDELLSDSTRPISEEQYNSKKDLLSELVAELTSYNLLPQMSIRAYNPNKSLISTVYINTLENKLAKYEDIRTKLQLFLKLLNNKFFVNKRFSVSRNDGLRVILKSGGIINDLVKLSSGEQNELLLLYRLIFEVPHKSILLIDEPELSLHVAWQLQFIQDIREIANIRDIQIVIATHSPQIVSQSLDDCIDLTEISQLL